jgi:uncharacterized protein YbjT (DUF2867 family)
MTPAFAPPARGNKPCMMRMDDVRENDQWAADNAPLIAELVEDVRRGADVRGLSGEGSELVSVVNPDLSRPEAWNRLEIGAEHVPITRGSISGERWADIVQGFAAALGDRSAGEGGIETVGLG